LLRILINLQMRFVGRPWPLNEEDRGIQFARVAQEQRNRRRAMANDSENIPAEDDVIGESDEEIIGADDEDDFDEDDDEDEEDDSDSGEQA